MPRHVRPTHEMQRAFLVSRTSVRWVFARPLNNQARYNDVDFTRLEANLSNTGQFARDMTTFMKVVFKQHLLVKESDVGSLFFRKAETTEPARSSMTHGTVQWHSASNSTRCQSYHKLHSWVPQWPGCKQNLCKGPWPSPWATLWATP